MFVAIRSARLQQGICVCRWQISASSTQPQLCFSSWIKHKETLQQQQQQAIDSFATTATQKVVFEEEKQTKQKAVFQLPKTESRLQSQILPPHPQNHPKKVSQNKNKNKRKTSAENKKGKTKTNKPQKDRQKRKVFCSKKKKKKETGSFLECQNNKQETAYRDTPHRNPPPTPHPRKK